MWDQLKKKVTVGIQNKRDNLFTIGPGKVATLGKLFGARDVYSAQYSNRTPQAPAPTKEQARKAQTFPTTSVQPKVKIAPNIITPFATGSARLSPNPIKEQLKIQPPTPTPVPTDYEALTMQTFDNHQIPREVAFGIAGAENGRINKFNIGAVDSNPGAAKVYDSNLAAATSAAKMLSGKANSEFYGNRKRGKNDFKKAYELKSDPIAMLKAIEAAGFAGDPLTWKDRSIATGGAGKYYDSWSDFIMNTPAWKKWYKKY